MTVRVVIADDQPLVLAGLGLLLEADPEIDVVATASGGLEAVQKVIATHPDVVVMDVRMPGTDGVEATRQIIASCGATTARAADQPRRSGTGSPAILILTTYDVDDAVYGALHAGAAGFLLKDAAPNDLVCAVHALAAGGGWLAPTVTRRLIDQITERPFGAARDDPRLRALTSREVDVLTLIAHGLNNHEIAARLVLGEGTVKTHVSHLLAKLELRDRAQAAVFAYIAGLVRP